MVYLTRRVLNFWQLVYIQGRHRHDKIWFAPLISSISPVTNAHHQVLTPCLFQHVDHLDQMPALKYGSRHRLDFFSFRAGDTDMMLVLKCNMFVSDWLEGDTWRGQWLKGAEDDKKLECLGLPVFQP